MNSIDPNDRDLIAALFAAGALPREQSDAIFESLLRGEKDTLAAIVPWLPVVAALADLETPIAVPPELRSKILGQIQQQKQPESILYRLSEAAWEETPIKGVSKRLLFGDKWGGRTTMLIRMEPGSVFPAHVHQGVEELFMILGDLTLEQTTLRPGDYQRFAAGTHHGEQRSASGCIAVIITTQPPTSHEAQPDRAAAS